jgi:MFS transporter, DHA2 family, multidrug resistance protein
MRNMGSSVGTSMVTTLIARRSQYHQSILVGNINDGNPTVLAAVNGLTQQLTASGLSPDQATMQTHARLYLSAQSQAATLAYIDTFWFLGILAAIMFVLSFMLEKNEVGTPSLGAEG